MNPFVYNSPVRGKDFFNREATVQKILRETVTGKSQGSIWITGERQVGKSSLMRRIQSMNKNFKETVIPYGTDRKLNVAFIFANMQAGQTEDDFYKNLWQGMKDFFDFNERENDNNYENFIAGLSEAYLKRNYYIVFLVDEFDAYIQTLAYETPQAATAFLAKLSTLLQEVDEIDEGQKTFSCVFTANHDIKELLNENYISSRGSGLIVESLTMKWFSKNQVKALARKYLRGNEIQFTDKELELCFAATHGYPYFTQKMLSMMYELKKRNYLSAKSYEKKVKADFTEMFKETLEDWGGENMPQRTLRKLKVMVDEMELGKQLSRVFYKVLETYIRAKMMA